MRVRSRIARAPSRSSRASRCRSRRSTTISSAPRSSGGSRRSRRWQLSLFEVAYHARRRDRRRRSRAAHEHAVRQHVAARGRGVARRRACRAGSFGRSAGRATACTSCAGGSARRARALTCSALKPQGLPAAALADLARRFAQGGIDYIKDDHGLGRSGLFAVRRTRRCGGGGAARRRARRAPRPLCAEPVGRSRPMRRQIAAAAARRHRYRDGRADDCGLRECPSAGARASRYGLRRPSRAWAAPRASLRRCSWASCSA